MNLQIPVISDKENVGQVSVSESVFGQSFNETLVHQLVVRHLAGARAGTKGQKSRSDVSGGGTKPWRQKGTGRARSGSTRGPIWRTGGVTFAAVTRDHSQKLNKKMFRVGLKSIFSELLRQDRLVISDIALDTPKTKLLNEQLKKYGSGRLLIITEDINTNLALASRNIPYVEAVSVNSLSPVALVSADKVIVTSDALKQLEGALA